METPIYPSTGQLPRPHGFSILELLVVLSIIGISLSMALPGFEKLTTHVRATTSLNNLRTSIKYAQSEALKRHNPVRLCPSDDGHNCDASGHWENGWIVYVDNSGKSVRSDADPILKVFGPTKGVSIRKNGQYLTVTLNASGQVSLNRSFNFCQLETRFPLYRLVLIHSGQLRISAEDIHCPIN